MIGVVGICVTRSMSGALERCPDWCRNGPATLRSGAKERAHDLAVVLRDYQRAALVRNRSG